MSELSPKEPWHGELSADLDELVAFDAMRMFLENWWKRGGKQPGGDAVWRLTACDRDIWASGMPMDPAMWGDWKKAVEQIRSGERPGGRLIAPER